MNCEPKYVYLDVSLALAYAELLMSEELKQSVLWSSFFVTLVAKKYRLATMLPFVPRMVCDSR